MARTWSEAISFAGKMAKNLPTSSIDAEICNLVSGAAWRKYPWRRLGSTLTNIAGGAIPLVDGTQDYSVPSNLYRLLSAYINRTDTTPDVARDIDVADDLAVDLVKRSYTAIRCCAHQAGFGVLRLESAVSVPTGTTLELGGIYQAQPTQVTSTAQTIWMLDSGFDIPVAGILYWVYKLADDPRAGGIQTVEHGKAVYTGQLAEFHNLLDLAWAQEELSGTNQYFPDSPMGSGRDSSGGLNIFPA